MEQSEYNNYIEEKGSGCIVKKKKIVRMYSLYNTVL